MINFRSISVAALCAIGLSACQTTSGDRMTQLAQICADPANRAPGTFYWQECQSLYPLTDQQRQQQESLARGVGNE